MFRSTLGRARGIIEYRVIQTDRGARVEIRGEADHEKLRGQLTRGLSALGVSEPDISITATSAFERQTTGKIRRFLALPA